MLAQLNAIITPLAATGSIISYLDKPEQMTGDIIKRQHPKGLMMVQYDESAGDMKTETIIVAVVCIAYTAQQIIKLGDAAREALNEFQIPGSTRIEFHDDKAAGYEAGLFSRAVRFRCQTPAVPSRDRAAAVAALNL